MNDGSWWWIIIVALSPSDRLSALLPEETKQNLDSMLPKNQFEIAYRLDCRNLCADFQEDIQFRFSFGITALMERFLGPKGVRTVLTGKGNTVSLHRGKKKHFLYRYWGHVHFLLFRVDFIWCLILIHWTFSNVLDFMEGYNCQRH